MKNNQEVLNAFMQAWIDEDYESMFKHSQKTWQQGREVKHIQTLFSFVRLKAFRVVSTTTTSSVARRFRTELAFDDGEKIETVINVICEAAPYKTATFGEWGVNPISVLNVVPKPPEKEDQEDEPKQSVPESTQKQGETETEPVKSTKKIAGEAKRVKKTK